MTGGRSRRLREAAAPGIALLAVLAFYAPLADRGFTSEDFVLLRRLLEAPPWHDLREWLAEPWLGIEVVRFYRPLALALLGLEAKLFGVEPLGYHLVHLALHGLDTVLVWRLAAAVLVPVSADSGTGAEAGSARALLPPLLAALLFALHPLHPNAVAWVASYATLFAATGVLAAALAWEAWRRTGRRRSLGLALAAYVFALGCYEAAVVLPLALLLREAAGEPPGAAAAGGAPPRRRRLAALGPFAGVAVAYLLLRRALFGEVLGGYPSFAERLAPAAWSDLAGDAVRALGQVLVPLWAVSPPPWVPAVVLAAATGAAFLLVPAVPAAARRAELGRWLFAWGWTALFLAPFAFERVVPANGRYVYLAVPGAALGLAQLAALGLRSRGRGRFLPRAAAALPACAVLVLWAVLLPSTVGAMDAASREARRIVTALERLPADGAVVFVSGHPPFLVDERGTPMAQVLHYGLADAAVPPFATARRTVYPLPDAEASTLAALGARHPRARFVRWDPRAGRLEALTPETWRGRRIRAAQTAPAAVRYRPLPGAAVHRLRVAARGNPTWVELPGAAGAHATVELPARFLRSMEHLYGGPAWWWIEALGADGAVLGMSPARRWRPG